MMEFGEAVLFARFLRVHGELRHRYLVAMKQKKKRSVEELIQSEEPALWFRWLAYKATYFHKPTGEK
jgi:hypothetical protein